MVAVVAYCGVAGVILLVQVLRLLRGMRADVLGALIDVYERVNEMLVLQRIGAMGRPPVGDQAVGGAHHGEETPEQWLARVTAERAAKAHPYR